MGKFLGIKIIGDFLGQTGYAFRICTSLQVMGSELRIYGLGFRVSGLGFRV